MVKQRSLSRVFPKTSSLKGMRRRSSERRLSCGSFRRERL
jgi:hypothetical protein